MKLENFQIFGFFDKNQKITINNNKIIIVADNGSGKTSLLRLIYFFLTKQWVKIIEYDFEKIIASIDGKEYSFLKKEFKTNKIPKKAYTTLAKKYNNYSSFINDQFSKYDINEIKSNAYRIEEIEQLYDVPKNLIFTLIEELELKKFDDSVYDWDVSVIYLPTYRRIEKDYFSIYGDIDKRVANYIVTLFPEIADRIINEKEKNRNSFSETEEDLNKIFSNIISFRNSENWLKSKSSNEKLEMIEFGMNDVNFKIKEFYSNNNNDRTSIINQFIALINKYLNDEKSLYFDEKYCELIIINKIKKTSFSLNDLSSGEKQLISLFSHLFFDEKKPFIIIDEPEISLSLTWQEMILNDIILHSEGIVVATHSPFIVSDLLRENTCGMNEFLINE
jgi:ABC-type transport system involved in cytochrome c biogenesis ATPase subunit